MNNGDVPLQQDKKMLKKGRRQPAFSPFDATTLTLRVDTSVNERLERLAKSTGRSRAVLAAEAINEYLDLNESQVSGIKRAIASLDRGEAIPHDEVRDWVASWGSAGEKPAPERTSKNGSKSSPKGS